MTCAQSRPTGSSPCASGKKSKSSKSPIPWEIRTSRSPRIWKRSTSSFPRGTIFQKGSIEAIRKDIGLRLSAAKEERGQIQVQLKTCSDELAKILAQEKEATVAKQKAEDEFKDALKNASSSTPNMAAPAVAPTPNPPNPAQDMNKQLDNNNQLLKDL